MLSFNIKGVSNDVKETVATFTTNTLVAVDLYSRFWDLELGTLSWKNAEFALFQLSVTGPRRYSECVCAKTISAKTKTAKPVVQTRYS